ncbi:universal stress protein [Nitratireductor luteus]|uniref:universal stress protein n=1 Tax=Nitratireductor luteus TaxID=2976980 RepID=UPI002240A36E|nr:universal stress protein [Nitratireductor luteus]
MSYKTIVAILQSEADLPRVLDFTLPFAARNQAHLIGLHAESLPIAMATPMGGPAVDYSMEISAEAERRNAELKAAFERKCAAEGVSHEWRGYENISGDSAISGIESARTADITIAQQNDPDSASNMAADVEALVFEAGRPTLLVPYTFRGRLDTPFKKPLVAWNGSKEAARATFDALSLLKEAGAVEVLTIDAEDTASQDGSVAGAAIAEALARHGVEVTLRAEHSGSLSHCDAISNRIADTGSDLLVMGAYGRSRISEFVFGGVTRAMLQTMTVPTLMSR